MASKTPINFLRGWPHASMLSAGLLQKASTTVLSSASLSAPALSYGPDWGHGELLDQLATWLTDFYKPTKPAPRASPASTSVSVQTGGSPLPITGKRLCVSGGASQNLANVLQAYTDPVATRSVWMVSPTFYLAAGIFADSGFGPGRVRAVPEDEEGVDVSALRKGLMEFERNDGGDHQPIKVSQPWNKRFRHVIYCVPTFANPSGKMMSLRRREALVRVAREHDALIVCDDVYDMLGWRVKRSLGAARDTLKVGVVIEAPLPRLVDVDRTLDGGAKGDFGNVVSQGSFSKLLGPGTRTGWAEGTEALAYGLSQVGSSRSGGAPSQLVATFIGEGLRAGDVQRHVAEVVRPGLAKRWERLDVAVRKELWPLGVRMFHRDEGDAAEEVKGGYFICIQLPKGISAVKLAERCLERTGLILAPGQLFKVDASDQRETQDLYGMVRLCFAWEEEDRLDQGTREMAEDLQRLIAEGKSGADREKEGQDVQGTDLTEWK